MLKLIKNYFKKIGKTIPTKEELLAEYPSHIDLLDSNKIPHDYHKGPDLSYYTETPEFYYTLICESAPYLKDRPKGQTTETLELALRASNRILNSQWGLIAKGLDALPYAVKLIRSKDRDLKESGAGVFCGLQVDEGAEQIVNEISQSLDGEDDRLVIDSLLAALGELKSRSGIPILEAYIYNNEEDGDTRWGAACSLGKIIRKRFDKNDENAVANAIKWLENNKKA